MTDWRRARGCVGVRGSAQWLLALCVSSLSMAAIGNDGWEYEVKQGDSLWTIAERYLLDTALWRKLRDLNKVQDPYRLKPGSALAIPLEWLRTNPAGATVTAVSGAATIASGRDGTSIKVMAGGRLQTGDTLATAPEANVTLNFDDGSRLLLLSDSELQFIQVRSFEGADIFETRIRLTKGRAENLVPIGGKRRFQMDTPSAITSVRGTGFRVQAEPGTERPVTRVEVLDGGVGVRNDTGTQNVGGGFGTVVEQGKPPAPPIRLLPAPDVGSLPTLLDRVPIEFAMPPAGDAVGFVMQIARSPAFEPVLFQSEAPARRLRGSDLPDGSYIARIRSVDRNGLEGFAAEHRFTLDARPLAPTTITPPPGTSIPDERPRFAWARNPEAARYHFQLATDPQFTRFVHEDATLTNPNIVPPVDLAPGRYHWRVAGIDAEGRGPWTDAQAFRRLHPGPALDRQPAVSDAEITLSWRAGDPGQTWQIQIAGEPTFIKPIHDRRVAEPQTVIPRPAPGRYYLRARTIDPDGEEGPFGSAQIIEVPAPPPPASPDWLLMLWMLLILAL